MEMEVTGKLIASARRGRHRAVVDLLAMHYRIVWRIAMGLTGRVKTGEKIVEVIMRQSLRAISTWTEAAAPMRWFQHHTVLLTREPPREEPRLADDTLLQNAAAADALYVAFIRALRRLPYQQREAYLLTHGEDLQLRSVAIAMDCSVDAAETHLRAAGENLRQLAGAECPILTARMADAYRRLEPKEGLTITDLRARVKKFMVPWMIRRTLALISAIVLLGAAGWGCWWLWQIVRHSMGR
jgi:DNA-directed RNA polymerase specialized sigma24 family protein